MQISDENLHRVRCVMDEVFGPECFIVTIPPKKKGSQKSSLLDPRERLSYDPLSNWWGGLGGAANPAYVVQTTEDIVERRVAEKGDPVASVATPTKDGLFSRRDSPAVAAYVGRGRGLHRGVGLTGWGTAGAREGRMPYTAEISRGNPSCFLFLIDQPGSMGDAFGSGESRRRKCERVADAINKLFA